MKVRAEVNNIQIKERFTWGWAKGPVLAPLHVTPPV